MTTHEPQHGVRRQELELPFLYLGRGGTLWRSAGTFEIEHPDSGQLYVRPTTRGQAVDPLIFAGVGAQRRRRGEPRGVLSRVQNVVRSSRLSVRHMTLRGSPRRLISSCFVSHLIASVCSTLHAVAKATAGSNLCRYSTASSSAWIAAYSSFSRCCDRRLRFSGCAPSGFGGHQYRPDPSQFKGRDGNRLRISSLALMNSGACFSEAITPDAYSSNDGCSSKLYFRAASDLAYQATMCGRPPIFSSSRSAYPMGKTGASGGPCCLNHSRAANAWRSNCLCFAGVSWQSTALIIIASPFSWPPYGARGTLDDAA